MYLKVWFNVNNIILERKRTGTSRGADREKDFFCCCTFYFHLVFFFSFIHMRFARTFYFIFVFRRRFFFFFIHFVFRRVCCAHWNECYVRFLLSSRRCVCFSCFSSFYFSIMCIRNTRRRILFWAGYRLVAHLSMPLPLPAERCYAVLSSLLTLIRLFYFRGAKTTSTYIVRV